MSRCRRVNTTAVFDSNEINTRAHHNGDYLRDDLYVRNNYYRAHDLPIRLRSTNATHDDDT